MGLYERALSFYYSAKIVLLSVWLAIKQQLTNRHRTFEASGIECRGKVAIVTGGSRAIGLAVVQRLAELGMHVIIGSRDEKQGALALSTVKQLYPDATVEFHKLDLMSTSSIRQFAEDFLKRDLPLHYLVNNAGCVNTVLAFNEEGVESTLMTNFVGPFLLTHQLLARLVATGSPERHARIVHVSSEGHKILGNGGKKTHIDWGDLNGRKFFCPSFAYAQSKAFQIMHAYKLQRLFHEEHRPVNALSVHPGFILTELIAKRAGPTASKIIERLIWTPAQAADTVVCALLKPDLDARGILYLNNCQEVESRRPLTYQVNLQDRLWLETCKMLQLDVDPSMTRWIDEVERVEKLFGVYKKDL